MDTPLQVQPIAAQHRMKIKGCRKDPITVASCSKKRIYAL